jgi:hypothetical protein
MELPTKIIDVEHHNPRNLIIISKPKVGKTEFVAGLPNALLLDFENGSDYVAAMKMKINSIKELVEVARLIKESEHKYDYVVADTITALENMCIPYAEKIYSKTAVGKNWFKKDENGKLSKASGKAKHGTILQLPDGAGYAYLRMAYMKAITIIKTFAPALIQLGHVKDISLEVKGEQINVSEIDLTGKLKRIAASESDAIGYLYRKGNQNILSFVTSDDLSCGARPPHLKNKEIVVSEMIDDELVTHWDEIYKEK